MRRYDYLIIGGGIAGTSSAEAIRAGDEQGTIAMVSAEPHLVYSRVLLPSYLKKKIPRERIFLRTRQDFEKKRIDVLQNQEVMRVKSETREVMLADGEEITYRKLLIASGGRPVPWGNETEQGFVRRLQTLDDADGLSAALPNTHEPLVIGSSFIALEFLEIFHASGIRPRLIARSPHLFPSMLDEKGGALLADNIAAHGIPMHFDDTLITIRKEENALAVTTARGASFSTDTLAIGIGIERAIGFLEHSGITLGKRGVLTNEFLETNVPGVFAAGDVAEVYHAPADKHRTLGNWANAVAQGTRAGANMAGAHEPFNAVAAYSITNFGMQITTVGECDDTLENIARQDMPLKRYGRFFIRGNALAGVALINGSADRAHLMALIKQKTPIEQYRTQLADSSFDIRTIPLI